MYYIDDLERFVPSNDQERAEWELTLKLAKAAPKDILTRQSMAYHVTSSGLIMNDSLDKMLMVHHNIYKTWAWTGGHADGDEDMLEVAIKEGKEETGLDHLEVFSDQIAAVDILPVYAHIKRGQVVPTHLHLNVSYVLRADEHQALTINEAENSGVKWVPIDEIDQYSNEPYLIALYQKIIRWARELGHKTD